MLVRPVIGVHRLSERLRSSLPVAVMVAITMGARLALPGYGPELLRHLLPFLRLLALLCLLTRALGGKLLLTLRIGGIANRKSPRLNSSPQCASRMPSSA